VAREVMQSRMEDFAALQQERFAACPEAAQYSDEEVSDFLAAAQYLDASELKGTVAMLRRAKIAFPPDLAFDSYRLGRHLLSRWGDPSLRDTFFHDAMTVNYRLLARLRRQGDIQGLVDFADQDGPPAALSVLRNNGLGDMLPAVFAAFSPELATRHQALLLAGKVLMHRFLTEPAPQRQPSRWEQRKLIRRIRLRDVQLRSMKRSLHTLRRERKSLLARLPGATRRDQPELDVLAVQLQQIRAARAELEQNHAATLAQQARQHQEVMAALQEQLASALQDYSDTVRTRKAWLSDPWR